MLNTDLFDAYVEAALDHILWESRDATPLGLYYGQREVFYPVDAIIRWPHRRSGEPSLHTPKAPSGWSEFGILTWVTTHDGVFLVQGLPHAHSSPVIREARRWSTVKQRWLPMPEDELQLYLTEEAAPRLSLAHLTLL